MTSSDQKIHGLLELQLSSLDRYALKYPESLNLMLEVPDLFCLCVNL